MALRLTKTQRANIGNNQELVGQIAEADIVAVENRKTGSRQALWKRPIAEVEARGLPTQIRVLVFEVSSSGEVREYQQIVSRYKSPAGAGEKVDDRLLRFDSGTVELVKVRADEIEARASGPLYHESLGRLGTAWARSLFKRVGHLRSATFEQWERGFLQEMHFESEIITWEQIARAFEQYLAANPTADKKHVMGTLSAISLQAEFKGGDTPEIVTLRQLYISEAENFRSEWKKLERLTEDTIAAFLGIALPQNESNDE